MVARVWIPVTAPPIRATPGSMAIISAAVELERCCCGAAFAAGGLEVAPATGASGEGTASALRGFSSARGSLTPVSASRHGTPMRRRDGQCYLKRRESRRSASALPPVWQVGQYCRDRLA